MSKRTDDDETMLPFPVAPVSNGEWCPLPITDKARLAARLIIEETNGGREAARHDAREVPAHRGGHDDRVRGAEQGERTRSVGRGVRAAHEEGALRRPRCRARAARQEGHRSSWTCSSTTSTSTKFGGSDSFCFLDFRPDLHPGIPCPQGIGQGQYIKDVFVDSHTTVGVLSGLPYGLPIGPRGMAETRDLVNELAGSERCLSQAVCDPTAPPGSETSLETMEHQVKELKGRALKCYTYAYGGWRLDDDAGTKMLAEATRLGITLVQHAQGSAGDLRARQPGDRPDHRLPGRAQELPEDALHGVPLGLLPGRHGSPRRKAGHQRVHRGAREPPQEGPQADVLRDRQHVRVHVPRQPGQRGPPARPAR